MTFTLEQSSLAYPHQMWLEFSTAQQEQALPPAQDYSHDAARHRAYLNRLCLNTLLPALQDETLQKQPPQVFPFPEAYPGIWEVVNGTAVNLVDTRLVIIPSVAIDTEEFCVPQEWVDIPEWAADYYLAVQVNLEDGWLRVWGFTTHRKLKREGRYDASDRTYCLDGDDLLENLNVMWVAFELCREEKAEIQPLPTLSASQIDRILAELGKPSPYSPRLKVPFAQWGALLASDNLRHKLYYLRTGVVILSGWLQNIFPQRWVSLDELTRMTLARHASLSHGVNLAFARSGSRSGDNESNRLSVVSRGRAIDLGIQLAGHPVALIVYFTTESEFKRNILLQVHPGGGQTYLPPGVQLIVLDETGKVFLEVQSRRADNWIQLEFRGEPGERFSVKVALGDASVTEDFVI